MMGRKHLVVGLAMSAGFVALVDLCRRPGGWGERYGNSRLASWINTISSTNYMSVDNVLRLINHLWDAMLPHGTGLVWVALAAAVMLLGSIFPDADCKTSLIGRYANIPGPHHGILHSDWLVLLLALIYWFTGWHLLLWFTFGVITHFLMDGMSLAKRVRFYPFGSYKVIEYDDGAVCAVPTNGTGFYRVGGILEWVVLGVVVAISGALVWLAWL